MRLMKPVAAALAIGMAATTFASSAEARHRHNHGGAFVAGAAGFAAGALLGSLAQPRYRCGYYDDCYGAGYYNEPGYYYAPAPVYAAPRAYYRQPPVYYRQQPVYNGYNGYSDCDSSSGVSRPATSMC